MLQKYHQHRKDLARLYRLREIGEALSQLGDAVMSLDHQNNQAARDEINKLRIQEQELLRSAIDDIPWYCKVIKV